MTWDLAEEAFRIEERGVDWRPACAGALAAVGPLAVGLALDETVAGLSAALGGLNTALCVPSAGLRERLWWGSLGALGGVLATALAVLAAPSDWALVALTLLVVAGSGLLRAAGPAGALVGFVTSAAFTILAGIPAPADPATDRVLWFLLGALPALGLMVWARRGPTHTPQVVGATLSVLRHGIRDDRALRAHVLRLALAVAGATLLYRLLDLPHGYWVPLTTLAILQPGEHATRVRALQRAAGTLGGAALIVAVTLVTDERWVLVACAAAAAFWLYALDARGYFWLVVMLTPTALLMLSVVDFQGEDIVLERVAESSLGIVIGLAIGELAWRLGPLPQPSASGTTWPRNARDR